MSQQDFLSHVLQMNLIGIYGILVVLTARLLLKKVGSRFAYYLWMIAFVNLLIPVTFSGSFSLIPRQIYELSAWENGVGVSRDQGKDGVGNGANTGAGWSDAGEGSGKCFRHILLSGACTGRFRDV